MLKFYVCMSERGDNGEIYLNSTDNSECFYRAGFLDYCDSTFEEFIEQDDPYAGFCLYARRGENSVLMITYTSDGCSPPHLVRLTAEEQKHLDFILEKARGTRTNIQHKK